MSRAATPGWIEVLNDFEGLLHIFEGVLAAFGNFFERDRNFSAVLVDGAEITVFVQISDDRMTGDANGLFDRRQAQLPFEVIGQRLRLSPGNSRTKASRKFPFRAAAKRRRSGIDRSFGNRCRA